MPVPVLTIIDRSIDHAWLAGRADAASMREARHLVYDACMAELTEYATRTMSFSVPDLSSSSGATSAARVTPLVMEQLRKIHQLLFAQELDDLGVCSRVWPLPLLRHSHVY